MTIPLGRPLPDASRDRPGRRCGNTSGHCWPTVPTWSCSRWGLPCRPRCRGRGALLPHRFTLTESADIESDETRGLFSVALSLGSPPPGVTRHRISMEPGLSSRKACASPAVIRPAGGLRVRSLATPRQPSPTSLKQIPPKVKTLATRICSKILIWRESLLAK